jgi:geranylgeranyl diphosphate synthase type I
VAQRIKAKARDRAAPSRACVAEGRVQRVFEMMGEAQARQESAAIRVAERFSDYAARIRPEVDAALTAWLDGRAARRTASDGSAADAHAAVDAVAALATRGGKRWRAVLIAAAYEGCGGTNTADIAMAQVAIELLQAYLLTHDDWMDGDDVRRGGPSVPAMLRERFGAGRVADSATILAGDYAAALALEALLEVPLRSDWVARAALELARVQRDVVMGQLLDLHGAPGGGLAALEAVYALKTGSYTVRGPLVLGAYLAGASQSVVEQFAAFALPLGIAFQLRDDLLGTFGDPRRTGKPALSDLREGKRTALVVELSGDAMAAPLLARVLGVRQPLASDVDALVDRMSASGARARVEDRLASLLDQANLALDSLRVTNAVREILRGAAFTMTMRDH